MKKAYMGLSIIVALVVGAMLASWPVGAQFGLSGNIRSSPIQQGGILNDQTTGSANTAVTTTLTGVTGRAIHIQGVSARCSAGTAGITIQADSTTVYSTGTGEIGTVTVDKAWPVALTALPGKTMTVELSACGASNTGTLIVQADVN